MISFDYTPSNSSTDNESPPTLPHVCSSEWGQFEQYDLEDDMNDEQLPKFGEDLKPISKTPSNSTDITSSTISTDSIESLPIPDDPDNIIIINQWMNPTSQNHTVQMDSYEHHLVTIPFLRIVEDKNLNNLHYAQFLIVVTENARSFGVWKRFSELNSFVKNLELLTPTFVKVFLEIKNYIK